MHRRVSAAVCVCLCVSTRVCVCVCVCACVFVLSQTRNAHQGTNPVTDCAWQTQTRSLFLCPFDRSQVERLFIRSDSSPDGTFA